MQDFGKRLHHLFLCLNITPQDLSKRLPGDPENNLRNLRRWLSGEVSPSLDKIRELAELTDTPQEWLSGEGGAEWQPAMIDGKTVDEYERYIIRAMRSMPIAKRIQWLSTQLKNHPPDD
ncbi:helix-turn-helix transcriptional regulator [Parendozoicomonas sp. Alg238-R29]|uniref:helix-turn-helix domain-containing protein n=1 Tax=Parendozoicomonas sp. Alg238-R29 TaxID=2993446 RepID=UPI00248F1CD2|nr:helix-turn-helix transcriptional regulator [Parendozoicomonas sp. Alg238-R29]